MSIGECKQDFHSYDHHLFVHDLIEQAINSNFLILLVNNLYLKILSDLF
jgi:hypothetical protein